MTCLSNMLSHHCLLSLPYLLFLDLDFSYILSPINIEVILPDYNSETDITSCNLGEYWRAPAVIWAGGRSNTLKKLRMLKSSIQLGSVVGCILLRRPQQCFQANILLPLSVGQQSLFLLPWVWGRSFWMPQQIECDGYDTAWFRGWIIIGKKASTYLFFSLETLTCEIWPPGNDKIESSLCGETSINHQIWEWMSPQMILAPSLQVCQLRSQTSWSKDRLSQLHHIPVPNPPNMWS